MLFSYNDLKTFLPVIIKGIVKDKCTGARLDGVHVFVKNSNNENFTNSSGEFLIQTTTSQGKFIVEKQGYLDLSISFSHDVYYIIQLENC